MRVAFLCLLALVAGAARGEKPEFLFIGLSDPVKSEMRDGNLPLESRKYYLKKLGETKGLEASDRLELVKYYPTGNTLKVRVPSGRGKAIAAILEGAKHPFVKFVDLGEPPKEKEP